MARTKLEYAGDFEIIRCTLFGSEGNDIEFSTEEIVYIDLFEDIDNAAISGELCVADSGGNLQQTTPLIGQEYLSLRIHVPGLGGEWDYIDSLMHVTSFVSRIDENKAQFLTMRFISREFVINNRLTISQTLKGSSSDIVENLLKNHIKTNKDLFIEPSSGNYKFIAPDVTPFNLIEHCKREAISSEHNSATYHFFENKEGYHFRSLESMYAQPAMQDYTSHVGSLMDCGTEQIEEGFSQILNYEINYSDDTTINQQVGQYSSKTIAHDIFNKRYDVSLYNYHEQFEDEKHINHFFGLAEYPVYNSSQVTSDESTLSDFPVKTYLMPVSRKYAYEEVDGNHNENGNYTYSTGRALDRMGQRTSRMMQLKNGRDITLTVHGNTLVSAGDMVEINLPFVTGVVEIDNRTIDRFVRGPHLVKRIRHNFVVMQPKPAYTMFMHCSKDCFDEELRVEGVGDSGQYKNPTVETEFYETGEPE